MGVSAWNTMPQRLTALATIFGVVCGASAIAESGPARGSDDSPPAVSISGVEAVSANSLLVTVVTDELATASVEASLQCDRPGVVVSGKSLGVFNPAIPGYEHEILVEGLRPNDEHFVRASATDLSGNVGTAEGECVGAVTPDLPRLPVEAFSASNPFDLEYRSVEFRPVVVDGVHRYEVRARDIDGLPVDPSGGVAVLNTGTQFTDNDAAVEIAFADGRAFPLHRADGVAMYGSVHIGSNGYVTFGAADTLPAPDINRFFEFARISAVWSDLNPWRGGTLSYRQLSDRFVVTWANMPRHLRFDSNTAQIELRFDGVIVISWLEIGAPETIVGISTSAQAAGAPAGFVSADMTSIGAALDPRPPLAMGQFVRAPAGGAATIGLTATDDGVPYNVLRYSVVGLPELGSLRDISTGHVLGPHDLPYALGSVAQVAFEPPSDSWEGEASFEFTASDLWPEIGFDTRSSQIDPTPNDGESAPAVVVVRAGERRLVRSFMVDDTLDESEWTGLAPGEWEFGRPTGGSLQPNSNDPTSGFTGQNVLGYNLEGDYENSLSPRHVISPPIDCTGFSGTRLRFMRWLCVQGQTSDFASVHVSTDGKNWAIVWENPASSPGMNATLLDRGWRMVEYDVSAVADDQPRVYLRWIMGPTGSSGAFAGWNIDDVRILGFVSTPCPADVTGDGVVNAQDLFGVLANFGLVDRPVAHDVNGDGAVDGEDLFLVLGAFNAVCE